MNAGRDALILVVILIALGVAAFSIKTTPQITDGFRSSTNTPTSAERRGAAVSSSPITKEELRAQYLQNSANLSSTPAPSNETEEERIEREIEEARTEIALIETKLEEIETYGEESPYKGRVFINKSTSGPRSEDVSREYIKLTTARNDIPRTNISKWRLESAVTGRSVAIGDAVTLFRSGSSNNETPLTVQKGDEVYVTTGRSPIGESFQINMCSGYFTQFQTFYPNISNQCPDPEEEILSYARDTSIFIDNTCMDFVERIRRCTVQTEPLPLNLSFACQEAIIEEINYNECVDKHRNEPDFYSGQWRVYLKRSSELWRDKREIIKLVDENGLTVDHYSY